MVLIARRIIPPAIPREKIVPPMNAARRRPTASPFWPTARLSKYILARNASKETEIAIFRKSGISKGMIFLKNASKTVAKNRIAENMQLCRQEILDFFTRKPENFTKALAPRKIKTSPTKNNMVLTKYLK
jgi:hypothetical protein